MGRLDGLDLTKRAILQKGGSVSSKLERKKKLDMHQAKN